MRYFLPKTADGKLLPLGCSESEFTQHVGSGVAIYMHFVKMTMWMFVLASVIALPQFIANVGGTNLDIAWPFDADKCPANQGGGFFGLVSRVLSALNFFIYAFLLGNVSFSSTYGFPHLLSELLLSTMFCVYVYWIWAVNHKVLGAIEAEGTRASDFAVMVSRLPPEGADAESLREHFRFFGEVASVVISNDQHRLIELLQRQQRLRSRWRHLHLEYGRALKALRAGSHHASGVQLRAESQSGRKALGKLLLRIESTWGELLAARAELREAGAAPASCTGHAIVIFRELAAAARCVRHFELIRRHERLRDGASLGALDFRQLYFRTVKLEVQRAPEPSDILWPNLRASRLQAARQNLKSTLIILLMSCVSTVFITATSISTTMDNHGLLTTAWSTPTIIVSNVAIFATVPQLAIHMERHHTRSSQHMHMLIKMIFFQLFNTVVACTSFMIIPWETPTGQQSTCPLPHPPLPPDDGICFDPARNGFAYLDVAERCIKHWYITGAVVLLNAVVGDLTAILGIIEFLRPDKLIIRYILAPRAPTQAEMNQTYTLDSELYVPFRYQLVLKTVCIAFTFCSAVPALLPISALFMYLSYKIDRYNLLRVFKPPPRTTDRTITYSVLYILPLAAFGHVLFAIFFYSKQAKTPVPLVYYAALLLLMAVVMVRISSEIRQQSQRPIREMERRDDEDEEEAALGGAAERPSQSLAAHLDAIELYVAPLSAELLTAAWAAKARERETSAPRDERVTSSTRGLATVEPMVEPR